jgi:hypothetical protein
MFSACSARGRRGRVATRWLGRDHNYHRGAP